MDFIDTLYSECKQAISPLFKKNSKLTKRIQGLLLIVIIIFLIMPIGINFLAMFELKYFTSMLNLASQIEVTNLDNNLNPYYNKIVYNISTTNLPINNLKNFTISITNNLFTNTIKLNPQEISNFITYVGFSFKIQLFTPIFLWNFIPLASFSFILSMFIDNGKLNKFISCGLYFIGLTIISVIYSGSVAYIISMFCFLIIISISFTKIITVIFSILLFILICYGIYRLDKKSKLKN